MQRRALGHDSDVRQRGGDEGVAGEHQPAPHRGRLVGAGGAWERPLESRRGLLRPVLQRISLRLAMLLRMLRVEISKGLMEVVRAWL